MDASCLAFPRCVEQTRETANGHASQERIVDRASEVSS